MTVEVNPKYVTNDIVVIHQEDGYYGLYKIKSALVTIITQDGESSSANISYTVGSLYNAINTDIAQAITNKTYTYNEDDIVTKITL